MYIQVEVIIEACSGSFVLRIVQNVLQEMEYPQQML